MCITFAVICAKGGGRRRFGGHGCAVAVRLCSDGRQGALHIKDVRSRRPSSLYGSVSVIKTFVCFSVHFVISVKQYCPKRAIPVQTLNLRLPGGADMRKGSTQSRKSTPNWPRQPILHTPHCVSRWAYSPRRRRLTRQRYCTHGSSVA